MGACLAQRAGLDATLAFSHPVYTALPTQQHKYSCMHKIIFLLSCLQYLLDLILDHCHSNIFLNSYFFKPQRSEEDDMCVRAELGNINTGCNDVVF